MTSAIDVQQQWLCEAMLVSSDEETDEEATPLRLLPGSVSSYDRAVSVMGTPDRKQLHNLRQQLQSFLREGVPVHERSQRFSAGLPVWRPRLLWLSTSLNSLCLRRPTRPKPGLRAVKLGGSLAGRRPYKKIRLGALVDVRKVGDKGQLCCVTAHGELSLAIAIALALALSLALALALTPTLALTLTLTLTLTLPRRALPPPAQRAALHAGLRPAA